MVHVFVGALFDDFATIAAENRAFFCNPKSVLIQNDEKRSMHPSIYDAEKMAKVFLCLLITVRWKGPSSKLSPVSM